MELFGLSQFMKKFQKKTTEADSLSSMPQLSRAGVKAKPLESARSAPIKTTGATIRTRLRLTESEANPSPVQSQPSRFRVVLIQEGLGNLGDCYYYTRGALSQAVSDRIFEGKKCFANHPDSIEERTRPERDVKDIIGHFENCGLSEAADGRGQIVADLVVLPGPSYDWARALMAHAVQYSQKYPDQDFVGLSINANGDAAETGLEQFVKENEIPEGAKAKLQDAAAQGVTVVRPVSRLSSAVSTDLVTEAGAGGRIAQMLEQEKNRMPFPKKKEAEEKKSVEKKEAEEGKKEAAPVKDGAAPAAADAPPAKEDGADGDAAGAAGDNDAAGDSDADQDKELIRSMLMKFLGDGHDDETYAMGKEALEACKSMGMDENEAMKAAGYAMKVSKHMAQKKAGVAPADGAGMAGDGQPAQAPQQEAEEKKVEAEEKKETEESKKESAKVLKLSAEIAKLKETIKKLEMEGCEGVIDKMLRESKLPMSATKKFRECLGAIKNEQDMRDKFRIFSEAYSATSGEAGVLGDFIVPEKTNNLRESKGIDFSDCVKNQD